MSEIRYDTFNNEYVIIAPERLHRPQQYRCETPVDDTKKCPFCPGREALTPHTIYEIKKDGHWQTRVVPNLYKALMIEAPLQSESFGLDERWDGFGAHEIVIDTPRHISMLDFTEEELFYWLKTIEARRADLQKDTRLCFISIFKNEGANAGATQTHPHTQIIAMPLMPKAQKEQFLFAHNYYLEHGRSYLSDIITNESGSEREIMQSEHYFVYAPYASQFPFEVAIVSKKAGLENLDELANIFKEIFTRYKKILGSFDFNTLFTFAPLNKNFTNELFFDDLPHFFRPFIRITPRLYKLAGFELQSGMKINPIPPEFVAKMLKDGK